METHAHTRTLTTWRRTRQAKKKQHSPEGVSQKARFILSWPLISARGFPFSYCKFLANELSDFIF